MSEQLKPVSYSNFCGTERGWEREALIKHMMKNPKPNFTQYLHAMEQLGGKFEDKDKIVQYMEFFFNLPPVLTRYKTYWEKDETGVISSKLE